jgi:hypothetical protein
LPHSFPWSRLLHPFNHPIGGSCADAIELLGNEIRESFGPANDYGNAKKLPDYLESALSDHLISDNRERGTGGVVLPKFLLLFDIVEDAK